MRCSRGKVDSFIPALVPNIQAKLGVTGSLHYPQEDEAGQDLPVLQFPFHTNSTLQVLLIGPVSGKFSREKEN